MPPASLRGGSPSGASRYSAVAIVLHWAIAAAIAGNLALGWWMHAAIEVQATQGRAVAAFQLHKSLGMTVLALSLLRLLWRLVNPPPAAPPGTPRWARVVAGMTHGLLYVLMIGIPLSGWLYVSTQWRGHAPLNVPTLWFGWFEVPHLFGLNSLERATRSAVAAQAVGLHRLFSWATCGLVLLHVLAALKHHLMDRDGVLARMVPASRVVRAGGFAAIALAGAIVGTALVRVPIVELAALAVRAVPPVTDSAVSPEPLQSVVVPAVAPASAAARPAPATWSTDKARSRITFSGVHAGVPFEGRFGKWAADIRFDPANLAASNLKASFETASASDGMPLHDESLPQAEWFDSAHHPTAQFRSSRVQARGGQRYAVDGTLTIKGHAVPVSSLAVVLSGDRMTVDGSFQVDRRAVDLGMESDPEAAWVSRVIVVDVHVEATRKAAA